VPNGYCTDSQFNDTRAHSCIQIGNTAYNTEGGRNGVLLLVAVGFWTVIGLIEGSSGAFFGKRILGLRVVGTDGHTAGLGRGAARGAMMLVDSSICFLIGLLTASFTHPHRRLGDMVAGTYVVGKESVGYPISKAPAVGTYVPYAPPVQQTPPAASQPTGGGFAPGTYGTSLPPSAPVETPAPFPTPPADTPAATTPADDGPGWAAPTPPADQPAAQQPSPWAAPTPSPQQQPQQPQTWGNPPQQSSSQWGGQPQPQQPVAQPQPQPQPAAPQPQWDPARNAWIVWEPTRAQWLQWDPNSSQWGPISQ